MQPKIKHPIENNSKISENKVHYTLKAGRTLPDEIKQILLPLDSVVRMELLGFLNRIQLNLKTGKGNKKELSEECSKYINLLQRNKKGRDYGARNINRNFGTGNPHTRRMDGVKKR